MKSKPTPPHLVFGGFRCSPDDRVSGVVYPPMKVIVYLPLYNGRIINGRILTLSDALPMCACYQPTRTILYGNDDSDRPPARIPRAVVAFFNRRVVYVVPILPQRSSLE